jgi:hypothetical protein
MKKILLAAVIFIATYFTANAQTKGTNTLGVGFNATTDKHESTDGGSDNESKGNSFTLGYGRFIKDNIRLGFSGTYNNSTMSYSSTYKYEVNGYGGAVSLQKYFSLVKKFYAFAGGQTSYMYSKQGSDSPDDTDYRTNSYFLGAYGGLTYFVSKHFALETDLLSGGLNYSSRRDSRKFGNNTTTNFNVSTSGTITNLGFRVYFLF